MPRQYSPRDIDLMIRTVAGEAGNQGPEGMAAVANVIANRLAVGKWGDTPGQVVLAPGQFEPWATRGQELMSMPVNSPQYKAAWQAVDGVLSGQAKDTTGGATHFFAPKAQAALGRHDPTWATPATMTGEIGGHRFYAPEGPAQRAISKALGEGATPVSLETALGYSPNQGGQPVAAQTNPRPTQAKTSPDTPDVMKLYLGDVLNTGQPDMATPVSSSAAASGPVDVMKLYLGDAAAAQTDPGAGATAPEGSRTGAALAGFVEGLPIIGPYAMSGVQKGAAAVRSVARDERYSDSLKAVQSDMAADAVAHPNYKTGGEIAGAVAGTVPAMAAAPGAFGLGAGNVALRAAASMGSAAGIGGADSAVRSGGDINEAAKGAGWGAAFGLAGPFAGKALGYTGNKLLNAVAGSTPAAQNVNNLFKAAGMTPQEARSALQQLGPNAVLADVNPALLTDASALAARGGETTATMKTAMQARAAGADDRAARLVEQHLGPRPDLNGSIAAIESDAATRAGPHYAAGRASAPMDVTHVLTGIDSRMANATGGAESVLNKVKGFLTDKVASGTNPVGLTVPKSDPQAILSARQALDDMIEKMPLDTSAGKNAYRVASDLRNQLDRVVKQNPDFAKGDAIYAQSMGIRDAMQEGVDVFKRNVRPEDLGRTIKAMTPEQLNAYRVGARQAIQDAMEQSSRGELAGAQTMFARGSANRAKLDALFPNARDALDALHSEATMRNTERAITGNSLTAERQAAGKRYSPGSGDGFTADLLAGAQGAALGDPTMGLGTAVARRGASSLLANVRNKLMDNMAQGTARGMVALGPEQQAFLQAIERARALQSPNAAFQAGADRAATLTIHGTRNKLTGR